MRTTQRIFCICLALCLLLCGCTANGAFEEAVRAEKALAKETDCASGALLQNSEWLPAGSSAADWLALTLKLGGVRENYTSYLNDLRQVVSLSDSASTPATAYARFALTAQALGDDPTAFGDGKSDLISLGYARYLAGDDTLNVAAFLLIAADACGYPDAQMRKTLVRAITDAQESDGGFGLVRGSSDADLTAMALQALSPYQESYADTVTRALDYLAKCVTENGACTSMGVENAETTAQVILALCALEIDIASDNRFFALPDGLARFRLDNGLYRHTQSASGFDVLATQQALLARIALQKGTNIYDF